ncbi:unnamed protein product [Brassica rapa subsp. narinosa]
MESKQTKTTIGALSSSSSSTQNRNSLSLAPHRIHNPFIPFVT